jgi:hypothetical protein
MITKEEYLEALTIVEDYHKQLNLAVARHSYDGKRILVDDWVNENRPIPHRVYQALIHTKQYGKNKGKRIFTYMDEVNMTDFLSIRNVGVKAWKDFLKLAPNYA